MSARRPQPIASEEAQLTLSILQDLGGAIRCACQAATVETLPREMGLLLLRLALAEVIKRAVEDEAAEAAREEGREIVLEGWARATT